jgi:hypothetical protein
MATACGASDASRDAGIDVEGILVPSACRGTELPADGRVDIDLRTVRLRGRVTLNGGALPEQRLDRGALVFIETTTGMWSWVNLGTNAAPMFDVAFPPGEYDVHYWPGRSCGEEGSQMPCTSGLLRRGLSITADTTADFDVRMVRLQGTVTLDGRAMPETATERATLRFENESGGFGYFSLPGSGPTTFNFLVMPGVYSVRWRANQRECMEPGRASLPCNNGVVQRDIAVNRDTTLALDVRAVRVRGGVTLNGAAIGPEDRVWLQFALDGEDPIGTGIVDHLGVVGFNLALLPGSYTVMWPGSEWLCGEETPTRVPCNPGVLMREVDLSRDTVLNVDVPTARLRGRVTLNGAPLPEGSGSPALVFEREGARTRPLFIRGSGAAATYDVTLFPGTYSVVWRGEFAACNEPGGAALPCNTGVVQRGVEVRGDTTRDVDVRAARLRTNVTFNGVPAGDLELRGQIQFLHEGDDTPAWPQRNPMDGSQYQLMVLPGTYRVLWKPADDRCNGDPNSLEPCNEGVVQSGIRVGSDTTVSVDVSSVRVHGSVTANGAPLPDAVRERASIVFAQREGGFVRRSLTAMGGVDFEVPLLRGSYVTLFDPRSPACKVGDASFAVPCGPQLVRGCPW